MGEMLQLTSPWSLCKVTEPLSTSVSFSVIREEWLLIFKARSSTGIIDIQESVRRLP